MNNNQQDNGNHPGKKQGPSLLLVLVVIFLITFVINIVMSGMMARNEVQISYNEFLTLVESGNVEQVQLDDTKIQLLLKSDADAHQVGSILGSDSADTIGNLSQVLERQSVIFYTGRMDDPGLVEFLNGHNVIYAREIEDSVPMITMIISWVLPIALMYLVYYLVFRSFAKRMGAGAGGEGSGGVFGVGKSKAKVYSVEKNTGVTFSDVAGQDEAKESLNEMVDYLHNPEKYVEIGAKQPRGALLVGPPGTGKTLLAKAVAGEANVPFFSLSGSEFVEMFVGVGASRVRDLFEQAKKNAPCIIFIDEIDAIGKSRDNQLGSNDEREQTLNQLLAEMDGFDSSKGIVVLAATNRPEVLDKALLRPGRFDRRIIVEKPDLSGRVDILKVHTAKIKLDADADLHSMALATSGATGADLANMVNEAALRAVRLGRKAVTQEDMMEAVELVIAGKEKKDRILSPAEKRMVAYHEVGHALVSALQKNSQPVQKITIVPRTMGSLGYTMNMPEEERYLMTRGELTAQICTLLGGRAAELLEFGEGTTGASNDIERATRLARGMVTQYGMSERFGPMGLESTQSQYLDARSASLCSEQTEGLVDEEVREILGRCQESAVNLLKENRQALVEISEYLIEKENINGEEFMRLLSHSRSQELLA